MFSGIISGSQTPESTAESAHTHYISFSTSVTSVQTVLSSSSQLIIYFLFTANSCCILLHMSLPSNSKTLLAIMQVFYPSGQ